MNDPLANLLARSFGHGLPGAVQPRLPARFEPATTLSAGGVQAAPAAGDLPPVIPEVEHLPALTPLLSHPRRAETLRTVADTEAPRTRLPERVGEGQRAEGQAGLRAGAVAPLAERDQPPTALPPVASGWSVPQVTPSAPPSDSEPRQPMAQPVTPQETTAPDTSREPITASVWPHDITPLAVAPRKTTVALDAPHPAASPSIPPQETSPMTLRESAAQTRLPRITVTIGRVEVRATPPSPPPRPRSQPPAPALSLDEYLKRRDGGKR